MKNLNSILESVIDITRKTLDPKIFNKVGNNYVLKPDITTFLSNVIEAINSDIVKVNNAFIKGSILSFQWDDNSDIDLLIEIDEMSEIEQKRIQNEVDGRFDGELVLGTEHPLQIYILPGKYDHSRADGIYRLDTGWVKGPYNIKVDLDEYMSKFRKMIQSIDIPTGELRRDLIDYQKLKSLPSDEIDKLHTLLADKLAEINRDVEDIIFQYKHVKDMRHRAFQEDLTPERIVKYGTRNALPENVIFKLMERYYYLKFMHGLKLLIQDGKIDDNDINAIEDLIGDPLGKK